MNKADTKQLDKLRNCKSADELMSAAKELGLSLTPEQADELLKAMSGELSDENLESVAGGCYIWHKLPVDGDDSQK